MGAGTMADNFPGQLHDAGRFIFRVVPTMAAVAGSFFLVRSGIEGAGAAVTPP